MSETDWQELSTAPTDVVVRLGRWELFRGRMEWSETMGAPWEAGWFGRKPTWYGREYTHWKPAPPPPPNHMREE